MGFSKYHDHSGSLVQKESGKPFLYIVFMRLIIVFLLMTSTELSFLQRLSIWGVYVSFPSIITPSHLASLLTLVTD